MMRNMTTAEIVQPRPASAATPSSPPAHAKKSMTYGITIQRV